MSKNGQTEEFEGLEMMDTELYTELDDERRVEFNDLIGLKVLGVELYEDSLGDEEEETPPAPEARVFFDCDLYLEDNQALELYVCSAYPDPEADPVVGMDAIFEAVGRLADEKLALVDFGEADEEGGLALAFGQDDSKVTMVLVCSAWMVSEWEADEDEDEGEV